MRDQERLVAHAHERLVRELLPDPRRPRAGARGGRAARGGAARRGREARRAVAAHRARARRVSSRSTTDGPFDPHVHEALLTQPSDERRAGLGARGRAARLPGRRPGRPARAGDRRRMTREPVRGPRRREERVRRRDQEGVPEARAPVPPGPQPGRRRAPRSGSRRCRARTTSLSDPEKRRAYDTFGSAGARGFPGGADMGGMRFEEFDLGEPRRPARRDVRRRRPARGEPAADPRQRPRDARADLVRGLAEGRAGARSGRGRDRVLGLSRHRRRARDVRRSLPAVRRARRRLRLAGPLRVLAAVPALPGNGTIVEKPCKHCRGSGRERTTKRYAVKIPAGAKSGTRVRLKGKGEAGHNGGPAGDLFVVVDVEPSPLYERRGSDLVLDVPVTYAEAALGASRRDPDAGRPGLAQGAERHREREAPAREGSRRAASQGQRARRPPRARQGHRSEEADEGREGSARGLPEGVAREPARAGVRA